MDGFGARCTLEGTRRLTLRIGFRHVSPRPVRPRAGLQAQEAFRNGFARLAEAAVPDGGQCVKITECDRKKGGPETAPAISPCAGPRSAVVPDGNPQVPERVRTWP